MTSNVLSESDLTFFGTRIEEVLKASLAEAGIPFHHVEYHPTKDGQAAVELVPFFSNHLQAVEDLIQDLFIIDTDRSICLEMRDRNKEQLPGTYLAYLDPVRQKLPEWKPFAEEPILILVSSLFQGVLFSILGFFSDENISDAPGIAAEIQLFSQKVRELDEGFSSLSDRHLQLAMGQPTSSVSPETSPLPSPRKGQETGQPAGQQESLPEKETLDMASVRLYLSAETKIVNMWLSVASESGITVLAPGKASDQEESLTNLFRFLMQQGIKDYETLEKYCFDKLGSWEKIYEGIEFARTCGSLSSRELGLYDLVLILIKARLAPFFQNS